MCYPQTLSVVIPVYCAGMALRELCTRILTVLTPLTTSCEIIFVEDCGPDNSWQIIQELAQADNRIRGIQMSRNFGQHNALLCGIRAAQGHWVITMDDDLQHPPEELPKLLSKLNEGFDVVYGSPEKEPHSFWRGIASQVTKYVLQSAMGVETARQVSALRVFRCDLRDAFSNYGGPTVNIDVLLTWGTTRFTAVTVRHEPRKYGQSGYTMRKLLVHAMNMITGFSIVPLQFAGLIGLGFAGFGFLVFLYVIGRYLIQGTSVPGFPFLAAIVAIFSGVQLFALGIMGEYLARMHFRTMDRPPYVVKNRTQQHDMGD